MTVVTYRNATIADAAALAELGRNSFVETFGHRYRPEDLSFFLEKHQEPQWRAELGDIAFAVRLAEADGQAIAYAKIGPPVLPVEAIDASVELRQFYVLAPWQGRGVAQQMMDWVLAKAQARGAAAVYLSVFSENPRARRFYERYGFRFMAPFTFMVGEQPDEDHILRLDLQESA